MEEKQNAQSQEVKKPLEVKSFRCAAPKSDWHIFLIALLTSAIVVAAYHVTLMTVDMFCEKEVEPVYCYCHQSNTESEEEKPKRKFSPEQMEKMKARREAMMKKLTPEQREKVKNMSKEERRAFFKELGAKKKAEGAKKAKKVKKDKAAKKEVKKEAAE